MASPAEAYYDELLERDYFASTSEALLASVDDPALQYRGRPCVDALRPTILTAAQYARAQQTANRFIDAMGLVIARLRVDPALQALLGVTPRILQVFARKDPALFGPVWQRLDGFLCPDGELRIIELNTLPGSVLLNDAIARLYDGLPIMQALRKRFAARCVATRARVVESLRPASTQARDRRTSNLAIIPPPGVSRETDAYLLELTDEPENVKALLAETGGAVLVGSFEDMTFEGGVLRLQDQEVDLVVPVDQRLLARTAPDHPVNRALEAGAARLLTDYVWSFAAGAKKCFEILTDPEHAAIFGAELFTELGAHVPWTRRVFDRKTTLRDEPIDLLPYITQHQHEFVLKPDRGTKGQGVVLGWRCSASEWQAALASCATVDHVVQARVVVDEIRQPINRNGVLDFEARTTDFSPFVWEHGGADAALIRMSPTGISNLGFGGTMTGLVIVQ